ncbi:hypothetical protein HDV02_006686 [Globomyces sp. JEL0801]|nr:hypothetical protein HDV02_006686 [Globomyces sp. JEL0801]
MKYSLVTLITLSSAVYIKRDSCASLHQQCGGKEFNGTPCCQPGLLCVAANEGYSQCRESTAPNNTVNITPKQEESQETVPKKLDQPAGNCNTGRVLWNSDFTKPFNSENEWEYDTSNYNGEKQIYVPADQAGTYIKTENNNLIVSASRDSTGQWKAARAVLKHGWGINYRAEVTVKMNKAVPGAFPAVWMLPTIDRKHPDGVWPLEGEIDIFEYQSDFIGSPTPQSFHFGERNGGNALSFRNCPINTETYNTLAVESTETSIRFFCNGQPNGVYNKPANATQFNWPYNGKYEFGFILNYAIEPAFVQNKVPSGVDFLAMSISSLKVQECF